MIDVIFAEPGVLSGTVMLSRNWVGERLRAEGLITPEHLALAIRASEVHAEPLEDALVRVDAISEKRLLRFLAEKTQTQYISSAKLAQLEVNADTLGRLPETVAVKLGVFPVRYDRNADELMIASPEAGIPELVKQVAIAARVRRVTAYLARPAAVRAAVARWYRGELQAFAQVAPELFASLASLHGGTRHVGRGATPLPHARSPELGASTFSAPPPIPDLIEVVSGATAPPRRAPSPKNAGTSRKPRRNGEVTGRGVDRRLRDLAEMLEVLVGLIESARGEFRGHSLEVARIVHELALLLGLDQVGVLSLVMAGNLHDVGKPAEPHLTLLSVNQYQPHRISAQQLVRTPLSWLAKVALPDECTDAVASMYERFDGRGFPVGLAGEGIPLGARVLTLVDAFHDLIANPRNPYRRTLTVAEAFEVIAQFQGSLFDPYVVERFAQLLGFVRERGTPPAGR
ncbi:MAG: HD domain-containing protein [Polyangiaceae bacterium]|nr:HD domain-containing protein [Polyangiaceae bacterium]